VNDIVRSSDLIVSTGRVIMNVELERMRKEEVVAHFKVLSRHSPRANEKNHDIISYDSRFPSRAVTDISRTHVRSVTA
jgi:hypothetical protein